LGFSIFFATIFKIVIYIQFVDNLSLLIVNSTQKSQIKKLSFAVG
jgi:hypothetical protein